MEHDKEDTKTQRSLRPSPKVQKQMQSLNFSAFNKMAERVIKTPARKPSPKSS